MAGSKLMPKAAGYYESDRSDFLDWVDGSYSRILDIGCGAGANADWYRRHGARAIVGVEVDRDSAARAAKIFDEVISEPIEAAVPRLKGPFDLIVCADVLEHLVDPWSILDEVARIAHPDTVLAVSIPNIRFLPAILRIVIGRGFAYEDHGIFDSTHIRFFTRGDVDTMLRNAGWLPSRWGAPRFGRLGSIRRLAQR